MKVTNGARLVAAATMLIAVTGTAQARQYTVAMKTSGSDGAMVFSPAYLKIAPGDEVLFVAVDKSHNAQSIAGLSPVGSMPFKGAMNQNVKVKFTIPGLYGYECMPHFFLGMVGLVQVGPASNKVAFQAGLAKLPPLSKTRMMKYLALVK